MALKNIPQRKCKKHETDLNSDNQGIVSASSCKKNVTVHTMSQAMFQSNYILG